MRARVQADLSTEGVPLALAPFLSTYGRHRRILLRLENLPERARLSRGRNNGDRSWSLMRDELDDLVYLPPQGNDTAHTVTVRVMNLEGGGETLALHELAIEPAGSPAGETGKSGQPPTSAELRKLREELANTKAALKAREVELASEQTEAARARADTSEIEAALAEAQVQFEGELKARLAAAEADAASRLDGSRAGWAHAQNRRLEESEARAQQRIEEARVCWRQESEAALVNAKLEWKAGEAVRLAAAEKQWRSESNRALKDAEQRLERVQSAAVDTRVHTAREAEMRVQSEIEAALAKAKEDWKSAEDARLAAAQKQWQSESKRALAEAEERTERVQTMSAKTRAEWEQEIEKRARDETQAALARAEKAWKAGEAARLTAAEKQWQKDLNRTLAEAATRLEQVQSASAQARVEWEQQAQRRIREGAEAALAKAHESWKAEEAVRMAEAESVWRGQSEEIAAELGRVRAELAQTKATLSTRERELARAAASSEQLNAQKHVAESELGEARKAWEEELAHRLAEADATATARLEATRANWKKETQDQIAALEKQSRDRLDQARSVWQTEGAAALVEAKQEWSREEGARLKAAEAIWRERSERALGSLSRDAESAEQSSESLELHRLISELDTLKSTLSDRESELTTANGRFAQAQDSWAKQEALRLAAAEAKWRDQSEQALETLRQELAGSAKPPVSESSELQRLGSEIESLKSDLSHREAELAEARGGLTRARERWKADLQHALDVNREAWQAEEQQRLVIARAQWGREEREAREMFEEIEEDDAHDPRKRMLRDGAIGVLLAAAAVLVYAVIAPVAEGFLSTGQAPADSAQAYPAPAVLPPAPLPPPPKIHILALVHGANLRAAPSASAGVVTTLARGTRLALIARQGDWAHVRLDGQDGKSAQEGWIFGSFLKDDTGG
jgi:exonuclease SbcC